MKRRNLFIFLFMALLTFSCQNATTRLFVGSYTKPGEKGLAVYDYNEKNGKLTLISQNDAGENPTYFCFSKKTGIFYVANEVMEFNGKPGGGLTALKYNEDGTFQKIGELLIPYGGPCFISMSPDSGYILLANYPKGSVAVVKLDNNGIPQAISDTILYVKTSPEVSHAHMIKSDPGGKKIYVSDLGLDRLIRYDFDAAAGKLHPSDTLEVPKGLGPRHFDFSKDGRYLYLINELGSRIIVFSLAGNKPVLIQNITTLKEEGKIESYCADIHISNDGKYLYGSNRGENSIVSFAVQQDGTLQPAGRTSCGGNWPRNFTLDPANRFLLVGNQKSDSMAVFRIDKKTGLPITPPQKYSLISPVCLKFFN